MTFNQQLKAALGAELCEIIAHLSQDAAAQRLRLTQPHISALRRGCYDGFSAARLLRLIASQFYNVEIHLRQIDRPLASPRRMPTLVVLRYDKHAYPIAITRSCSVVPKPTTYVARHFP